MNKIIPKQKSNKNCHLLETLHTLYVFPARFGYRRVGEIYLVAFKVLWLFTSASFISPNLLFFFFFWIIFVFDSLSLLNHPLTKLAHHNLHHRQMLQIIMCLEKRISSVEFYKDTAYTEHVAGIGPRETKYDFGGTIVPGRDDRGMVFRLECGRTEIDKTDFSVLRRVGGNQQLVHCSR